MMKLLQAHSLTVRDTFVPESMSLNLSERQSTATVTVGPSAPTITVGDWIQDATDPGAGIVWRVKTVDTQFDTDTRTIQLEHLIMALKDMIMFGEVKPSDMGGSTNCSAYQAVTYILGRQSDWALGTFSYSSVHNPYNFNGDDLMSALETVSSSLEDCWWSYDFSEYPFELNITARSETVGTELRLSRNIQSAKHTVDRSRMYTRLYPIGKNNIHIDGNYVSRNENLYGTICKTETDQSKASKAELLRWANERIANHCEPAVTVTVQAIDLSEATGETLDALTLGAVCRMPIPGLPAPIQETITKISWSNKIAEPARATVTLANIQEDVASIVNQLIKSGGGGGRAAAKAAEEDHAWFVDTDTHVGMIAEGIAGEGADQDWSRVASLMVDGDGIHQRVVKAQGDIIEAFSTIDATEDRIMLAVQDNVDGLHSEITQTASDIQLLVENTLDDFYTQIIQEASQIVIRTGDNTKTFKGRTQPTGTQQDPLVDGDLWFEGDGEFTWGDAATGTWLEDAGQTWADAIASTAHRYNGTTGLWEKVMDAKAVLQDTRFEESKQAIRLMAGRVDVVEGKAHAHYAELKVGADQIRSTVNDYYEGLSSSITQTASQIRSEVTDTKNELQGSITVESNRISLVVEGTGANAQIKPASIVAAINNGSSSIIISANHINLDGYVKATDITADYIKSKIAQISALGVNTLVANSLQFAVGGGMYGNVSNAIMNLQIHQDGNNYQVWGARFNGDIVKSENFSRATSLSGAWGGGEFTVSASPQGNTYKTALNSGSISRSGRNVSIPVRATLNGGSQNYATGFNATGTITAAKSDISAQRGSRNPSEPSADERLAKCSLNGWYVVTVSVLGATKTYKFQVEV